MDNKNNKSTGISKRWKFLIGTLASLIIAIFVSTYFVPVKENNGLIVNGNYGTINYNSPVPTETEKETIEYEHSYINMDKSIIKTDSNKIDGILTKYSYKNDPVSFKSNFGEELITVKFRHDQIAFELYVIFDEVAQSIEFEDSDVDFLIYDYGHEIKEGTDVQISPYDFDNDGINELVVCMRNGFSGLCYVFSYTYVKDKLKLNCFMQEFCDEIQEYVYLKGDKIIIPIGGQGYCKEYKYIEKRFIQMQ